MVAWLLIFSTFNIISFTNEVIYFGDGSGFEFSGMYFAGPGINPLILLIFILYAILNRTVAKSLFKKLFRPTQSEAENDYRKKFDFYYDKFLTFNDEEFNKVTGMLKDYPVEAQEAIRLIAAERNI